MQSQLFPDVPVSERKRMLSDNCDRVEETEYLKPFDADNLTQLKDKHTDVSIELMDIEEEKKSLVAELTERMKFLKAEKKLLLESLRNKAERVKESCYLFFDQENKVVSTYNSEGRFIASRPMKPAEMQKTVFSSLTKGDELRTGTND